MPKPSSAHGRLSAAPRQPRSATKYSLMPPGLAPRSAKTCGGMSGERRRFDWEGRGFGAVSAQL
eukprot:3913650-Pleurochrysis_carterae.AAC.1